MHVEIYIRKLIFSSFIKSCILIVIQPKNKKDCVSFKSSFSSTLCSSLERAANKWPYPAGGSWEVLLGEDLLALQKPQRGSTLCGFSIIAHLNVCAFGWEPCLASDRSASSKFLWSASEAKSCGPVRLSYTGTQSVPDHILSTEASVRRWKVQTVVCAISSRSPSTLSIIQLNCLSHSSKTALTQ